MTVVVDGESESYVTTSEVSTLKHEVRDYTMELAALVAEALLAGAEGTEVLSCLRDHVVEELEVDAAGTCWHCQLTVEVIVMMNLRLSDTSLDCILPLFD